MENLEQQPDSSKNIPAKTPSIEEILAKGPTEPLTDEEKKIVERHLESEVGQMDKGDREITKKDLIAQRQKLALELREGIDTNFNKITDTDIETIASTPSSLVASLMSGVADLEKRIEENKKERRKFFVNNIFRRTKRKELAREREELVSGLETYKLVLQASSLKHDLSFALPEEMKIAPTFFIEGLHKKGVFLRELRDKIEDELDGNKKIKKFHFDDQDTLDVYIYHLDYPKDKEKRAEFFEAWLQNILKELWVINKKLEFWATDDKALSDELERLKSLSDDDLQEEIKKTTEISPESVFQETIFKTITNFQTEELVRSYVFPVDEIYLETLEIYKPRLTMKEDDGRLFYQYDGLDLHNFDSSNEALRAVFSLALKEKIGHKYQKKYIDFSNPTLKQRTDEIVVTIIEKLKQSDEFKEYEERLNLGKKEIFTEKEFSFYFDGEKYNLRSDREKVVDGLTLNGREFKFFGLDENDNVVIVIEPSLQPMILKQNNDFLEKIRSGIPPSIEATHKTETITLNLEQKLQEFTNFYKAHKIDTPPDFENTIRKIWQNNSEEIKKAIQEQGFNDILIIPGNLPLPALHTKMTEGYNTTYEGNNFKSGGSFAGGTSQNVDKPRIVLVHNAKNLEDHPELKKTLNIKGEDALKREILTLEDYLLFQRKYFQETGQHLDEKGWTWLATMSGTRLVNADWNPGGGGVIVDARDLDFRYVNLGARPSRSFF